MSEVSALAATWLVFVCVILITAFIINALVLLTKWIKLEIENVKEGNSIVNPQRPRRTRKSNFKLGTDEPAQHPDRFDSRRDILDSILDGYSHHQGNEPARR